MKDGDPQSEGALHRLARRAGIELEYENARGEQVTISGDVIRSLLAAMGMPVSSEADAESHLARLEAAANARLLPPALVARDDQQPVRVPLKLNGEDRIPWRLTLEDGRVEQGEACVANGHGFTPGRSKASLDRGCLVFSARFPLGYHLLEAGNASMRLIIVPPHCWIPAELERGDKIWGVATQLYLIRSSRNWGIGDFTDLRELIKIAANWGADVIGLNPLHAMFIDAPEHASPYSPASRLFLNILNIDVTAIPEFSSCADAQKSVHDPDFEVALRQARSAGLVDYETAAILKIDTLRSIFACFRSDATEARHVAFAEFRRKQGVALERYCIFQTIRINQAAENPAKADWRQWPDALRDIHSTEVARFASNHCDEIEFLAWMQWIAHDQLESCANAAHSAGMMIGLYRDLAVGADASGAETWTNPGTVVAAAHAGAPPDVFNSAGQDWGLPPFNPAALREEGYTSFVELVRANMRYAGALRIDHVIGLQHLYWIAEGCAPSDGAYVTYPFEDLAGILALESWRNQCLVIGEDLGTVPTGLRDKLARSRILSYRVLYFEQDKAGRFVPPEGYPTLALATVGSHDLPTIDGWWRGSDIEIRERNNLYPDPGEGQRQRDRRAREKRRLLVALRDAGLDPGDGSDTLRLAIAVHAFVARSSAAIAMVKLDDLTGEAEQVNMPATTDQYPNWRRRLSVALESLNADPRVAAIVEKVSKERPRTPPGTET